MPDAVPSTMRQLRSTVDAGGRLTLELLDVDVPTPGPDDVLIRVEATPVNPSDLGMLLAGADVGTAEAAGTADRPVVTVDVPPAALSGLGARLGRPMIVGNEGAGVVVATGDSADAASLLGRTVAGFGGGMYGEYRCLPAAQVLPLPDGTAARDGASCFVNPLTALGMVETMRSEGHIALVHTAAASNLGRMLVRICVDDGVELVNVVRRPEQAELLASLGASHVCDSSSPSFDADLTAALSATGATIAFDAIGGGPLAGQLLACMEAAITARGDGGYNRYGSTVHKQVYIYGTLDRRPTEFTRTFGAAWGVGGWLLTNFLQRIGPESAQALRQRVVDGLHTTFASTYTREVSLTGLLDLDHLAEYSRMATGEKYLVVPSRG